MIKAKQTFPHTGKKHYVCAFNGGPGGKCHNLFLQALIHKILYVIRCMVHAVAKLISSVY